MADVEGGGAATELALAAGAVGAAGLTGGVEFCEELAVYAALGGEARLATRLKGEAQAGGGRGEAIEEGAPGLGVVFVGLDPGGGEAADDFPVHGGEGGVDDGDARACEGLGEGVEEVEVYVGDVFVAAMCGYEWVAAPVEAAGVAQVGDEVVEEGELVGGGRDVGLEEGAGESC